MYCTQQCMCGEKENRFVHLFSINKHTLQRNCWRRKIRKLRSRVSYRHLLSIFLCDALLIWTFYTVFCWICERIETEEQRGWAGCHVTDGGYAGRQGKGAATTGHRRVEWGGVSPRRAGGRLKQAARPARQTMRRSTSPPRRRHGGFRSRRHGPPGGDARVPQAALQAVAREASRKWRWWP
jgi:hypothetical protein